MMTRLLPPAEWYRLESTDLRDVWRDLYSRSEHVAILVAEDDAGEIIGHVVMQSMIHVEGFASSHPPVMWALVKAIKEYCATHQIEAAWSSAMSPVMDDLLRWRGAEPLPGQHYLWYPNGKRTTLTETDPCPSH